MECPMKCPRPLCCHQGQGVHALPALLRAVDRPDVFAHCAQTNSGVCQALPPLLLCPPPPAAAAGGGKAAGGGVRQGAAGGGRVAGPHRCPAPSGPGPPPGVSCTRRPRSVQNTQPQRCQSTHNPPVSFAARGATGGLSREPWHGFGQRVRSLACQTNAREAAGPGAPCSCVSCSRSWRGTPASPPRPNRPRPPPTSPARPRPRGDQGQNVGPQSIFGHSTFARSMPA